MFYFSNKKWAILSLTYIVSSTFMLEVTKAEDLPKGIGPIKELKLEAISLELATAGKKNFDSKCTVCHKMAEKYTGPMLSGVSKRRSPEWIMNMILNPAEMIEKDPIAQELLAESNFAKMASMNVSQDEARSILEYFRYYDDKGEIQNVPTKEEKPNKIEEKKKTVTKKKK